MAAPKIEGFWSFREIEARTRVDRRKLSSAAREHNLVDSGRRGKSARVNRGQLLRLGEILGFRIDFA